MDWLPFSFATLLLWGVWNFLIKLASMHLNTKSIIIYDILGNLLVSLVLLLIMKFKVSVDGKGITYALLAGIAVASGTLLFIYALSRGKAAIVISLTALYPVVSILLAYFFIKEAITARQVLGIATALVAFVLLTG